ncbi:STAS domain-containing protein [Micromonospora sp. NPDC051227]|uniref:STAS domain-containing protein n=1 Tax=Micromonospora sp. NPDC051227 TaxID=3364285 RepID=UPI0037891264
MTAVPDEYLMTLICDTCGETIRGTACVLPDAEVVWTLVAEHAWSGSPFATGPHRCPHCSLLPASTGGHASRDDHGPGGILGTDPTGLGLLVRAHPDARERGVTLCLAAPSRFIRTVLHTMRLDGAFPIFDSRDDALAELSVGGERTLPEGHAVAVPR